MQSILTHPNYAILMCMVHNIPLSHKICSGIVENKYIDSFDDVDGALRCNVECKNCKWTFRKKVSVKIFIQKNTKERWMDRERENKRGKKETHKNGGRIDKRNSLFIFTVSRWWKKSHRRKLFKRFFWSCDDEMSKFVKVPLTKMNERE